MNIEPKKPIFLEIKEDLGEFFSAWKGCLKLKTLKSQLKKFLLSLVIGLGVTFVFWLVFWLLNTVYAQGDAGFIQGSGSPAAISPPWIITAASASVFVGFARAKYCFFKRCFDFTVSLLGLIILSPLFLIVAILVKVDSQGPVFFGQKRLGLNGRVFKILKFRTMRDNAELETGPVWTQNNDPRITRIGEFLRKAHLDEIPQLINIFQGQMSLIGPRPERPEFVKKLTTLIPKFPRRLKVRPGITGLAQTYYRYGASAKDASRKLKYDLIYIKRMCWLLDIQILFKTAARVLTGDGAR